MCNLYRQAMPVSLVHLEFQCTFHVSTLKKNPTKPLSLYLREHFKTLRKGKVHNNFEIYSTVFVCVLFFIIIINILTIANYNMQFRIFANLIQSTE